MSQKSVIPLHIEITPGVCGGKPRIAGHRIKVQDIAVWHEIMGLFLLTKFCIITLVLLWQMSMQHCLIITTT